MGYKKKILFIADFFANEIPGGGELCSEEVITHLSSVGYSVTAIKSKNVTIEILKQFEKESFIFVSNFTGLSEVCKAELAIFTKYLYVIIEHDHKYCESRNPMVYPNLFVPENKLRNKEFFENALFVLCQSKSHAQLLQKNVWNANVVNLGCNLWSDKTLKLLEDRISTIKTNKYISMKSTNPIKGTLQAIDLCESRNLVCKFIEFKNQETFFDELAKSENFIFLPQSPETYSRVAIEAKILGCNMISNKAIGVMSEDYYSQNGKELLETIRKKKKQVLQVFEDMIEFRTVDCLPFIKKPKVSLITTLYKGSQYLPNFLSAFTSQVNPGLSELVIIEANLKSSNRS